MCASVKICGLSDPRHVDAAVTAGARYLGFVFFPKSPRNVSVGHAAELMADVPVGVAKVALTVNADDVLLDRIVSETVVDMLQLHGAESPERVVEVKARYGLPVMKAIGIAGPDDVGQIELFAGVADQLLIDAKPPPGASRPGGNALAFDWGLIEGRDWPLPWLLAGGLTPETVADAVARTGARQIDVSSGVEVSPGHKDPALIRAFIAAARGSDA